jgi:hypothetical protein
MEEYIPLATSAGFCWLPISSVHPESCQSVSKTSNVVLDERSVAATSSNMFDDERSLVGSSESHLAEAERSLQDCAGNHATIPPFARLPVHSHVTVRNTFVHFPSASPGPLSGILRKAQSMPATPVLHSSFSQQLLTAVSDGDSHSCAAPVVGAACELSEISDVTAKLDSHDVPAFTVKNTFVELVSPCPELQIAGTKHARSLPTSPWLHSAGDFRRQTLTALECDEELSQAATRHILAVKNTFIEFPSPSLDALVEAQERAQSLPATPFWSPGSGFHSQIEAATCAGDGADCGSSSDSTCSDIDIHMPEPWAGESRRTSLASSLDLTMLTQEEGIEVPMKFGTVDWVFAPF